MRGNGINKCKTIVHRCKLNVYPYDSISAPVFLQSSALFHTLLIVSKSVYLPFILHSCDAVFDSVCRMSISLFHARSLRVLIVLLRYPDCCCFRKGE